MLKSSVKCVFEMHLMSSEVKCICRVILDVKSSRDGFNVLDNSNVSSIKTANTGNKVDALNVGRINRLKLSASKRRTQQKS